MPRLVTLMVLFALILCATPSYALDFTTDDFDVAPGPDTAFPEQKVAYELAVGELESELTIISTDDDGVEIFRLVPYPLELVALITQRDIIADGITTIEGVVPYVEQANMIKPAMNSFTFRLEGVNEWASRDIQVFYVPDPEEGTGIEIPVDRVGEPLVREDGIVVSQWILWAENADELSAFLFAPEVKIVVGVGDESIEPAILDCGFWRNYSLFDLRKPEETPEITEEIPAG